MMDQKFARELGHEIARFARDRNQNPKSHGYSSYVRGHFQVLCTKHAELRLYREEFMRAAGVK